MGLVQSTLILVGASYGLGKSATVMQPKNLPTAEQVGHSQVCPLGMRVLNTSQLYKVSNMFYILTLGSIKCSATCFIANLTVKNMGSLRHVPREQLIGLCGSLVLSVAWAIGSVIALSFPCEAYGGRANRDGMCMGTVSRWVGVFIGNAITDIVVVVYAATVIWRTQASISKRLSWYLPFIVRGM